MTQHILTDICVQCLHGDSYWKRSLLEALNAEAEEAGQVPGKCKEEGGSLPWGFAPSSAGP